MGTQQESQTRSAVRRPPSVGQSRPPGATGQRSQSAPHEVAGVAILGCGQIGQDEGVAARSRNVGVRRGPNVVGMGSAAHHLRGFGAGELQQSRTTEFVLRRGLQGRWKAQGRGRRRELGNGGGTRRQVGRSGVDDSHAGTLVRTGQERSGGDGSGAKGRGKAALIDRRARCGVFVDGHEGEPMAPHGHGIGDGHAVDQRCVRVGQLAGHAAWPSVLVPRKVHGIQQ
mmetsp:Transcript_28244/g.48012  ORF Transcript_28244/g.48012 Transcript_28244/m.48012 type:complete len:227 (-) Transcript_28244:864-1544(-)